LAIAGHHSDPGREKFGLALMALAGTLAFVRYVSMHSGAQAQGRFDPSGEGEALRGSAPAQPAAASGHAWRDVWWGIYQGLSEHRVLAIAGGVTFYALLAIFPAIAALVALYGLFAAPATIVQHLDDLASFFPGGAMAIIGDEVNRLASQGAGQLGVTFLASFAISLWSANAGMKALFDALNIVYGEPEKRGFIKLNLISLGFTLVALVMLLLAIGAIVVVPVAMNYLGIAKFAGAMPLMRWPLLWLAVALVLTCLYRWGPSREESRWRWITWGSAFGSFGWLATSMLFSWYVENFGSYDRTYGSLGAVIGFMTWIWLSTIVKLIGAELDVAIARRGPARAVPGSRDNAVRGTKPPRPK
jgi:membrane protein